MLMGMVVITFLLENADTKLYSLDSSALEVTIPIYVLISLIISIPVFYLFRFLTEMKLKMQGYPCDKILDEVEEFLEKERKGIRES